MKQVFEIKENTIVQRDTACFCDKKADKFVRCTTFDKPKSRVIRVKKILTWINDDPITLVNCRQADFIQRTKSFVGQIKNLETSRFYENITHGEKTIRDEFNVSDILRNVDLNKQTFFWWECVQHLNNYRQKLKKRMPEIPFLDIEDEFYSLDKESIGILPEDKVFLIFEKYHIYPNKKYLEPLMDTLQLRTKGNVNYRKLLNLLNWKRSLRALPKIKLVMTKILNIEDSLTNPDCIKYNEDFQAIDSTKVRAAGLPSERLDLITMLPRASRENLSDQTSVHCLISPSIFTRYGLTHIDLFKIRDKEEIRNIFKNIGFEFPEDVFDNLWQEGMKKDCSDGVCVETFRELLVASRVL